MNTLARLFGNMTTLPTRRVLVTSSYSSFISRAFTSLVSNANTLTVAPAISQAFTSLVSSANTLTVDPGISRGFTSLVSSANTLTVGPALVTQTVQLQPCRNYKVRHVLKKRCAGCYFEKRFGRLYIECSLKARHKQMQLVSGYGLYKDDYSTKNWKKAVHWGYRTNGPLHKWGDSSEYSKFNWLEGRLGKDL